MRTSRSECPVIVAISASVHSAIASRVTAVPRKSLKVTRSKGRSKPVGRPGPSIGVQQHPLAAWFGRVKNLFQQRSYGNYDARAGLRLLQAYAFAVIGVPGETQQVALPLTGPQRN